MQYKQSKKIIIDSNKLAVLIRIGCPDKQLLDLIKTGTFERTGDTLIDDTLECLIDLKTFKNWGGKRDNAGRPKKNQLENQDENQLENQDGNQDAFQVVDKDIDKDKEVNKGIKERGIRGKPLKEKEEDEQFETFWNLYTPVKCSGGKITGKGSKKKARECFKRALKSDSFENIKEGLLKYLEKKAREDSMTAYVTTFLNEESWKDDDNGSFILPMTKPVEKSNTQKTFEMINKLKNEIER